MMPMSLWVLAAVIGVFIVCFVGAAYLRESVWMRGGFITGFDGGVYRVRELAPLDDDEPTELQRGRKE